MEKRWDHPRAGEDEQTVVLRQVGEKQEVGFSVMLDFNLLPHAAEQLLAACIHLFRTTSKDSAELS